MLAAFLALVVMSKYQKAQASKTASVSFTTGSEKTPESSLALKFMDKSAKTPMERLPYPETKTTTVVDGFDTVENENREKQKIICWNCGKVGHIGRDCRLPRKGGDAGAGSKGGSKGGKVVGNGKGIRDCEGGVFKCDPSVSSVASASARKVGMNGKDAAQVKCSECG